MLINEARAVRYREKTTKQKRSTFSYSLKNRMRLTICHKEVKFYDFTYLEDMYDNVLRKNEIRESDTSNRTI